MNLSWVNSVATVVTFSILYESDERFGLIEFFQDELNDVNVCHFVVATNVVNFADFAIMNNKIDSLTVIFDVKPVANVLAVAVDRKGFIGERVNNHQRDKFFWEVIRTVVVGTARDGGWEFVGAAVGEDEEVSTGLGRRVWRRGVDGRGFRKEEIGAIERKIAVNLVG